MRCDEFLALPLDLSELDDASAEAWQAHLAACRPCEDVYLGRLVRHRGADPADFPCVHVAERVTQECPHHDDPMDCPDAVVVWVAAFREWGLPVRDGDAHPGEGEGDAGDGGRGVAGDDRRRLGAATSYIVIRNCPWCGAALPPSLRAEWFRRLALLGVPNPGATPDDVPEAFRSDAWWREPESGAA